MGLNLSSINWGDRRFVSLAIFAVLFVSTSMAVAIPFPIMPLTRIYYETIEDLPVDGAVGVIFALSSAGYKEIYPPSLDTMIHLAQMIEKKNIRVVMWTEVDIGYAADFRLLMNRMISDVWTQAEVDAIYGINFVNVGVIPTSRAATKLFSEDMRAVTQVDDVGTPLDSIPMMANINDGSAFDLVIALGGYQTKYIEDYHEVYGQDFLYTSSQNLVKAWYMVITAGDVKSALGGVVAGAEYESILGIASLSSKYMFGVICCVLFGLFLIVLANVRYFYNKARGKQDRFAGRGTDRYARGEGES
jgi:hypothetical protein